MTYEFVEQLSDAGFPCDVIYRETWPTLSELIEACGDFMEFGLEWRAGLWTAWKQTEDLDWEGKGETPEEAVARLWLALHKN